MLCYGAEKLLKENGDKLDASDKTDVESKVSALKEAINKGDTALMKTGMEELQKALYAASEKLYKNAAPQDGQAGQGGQPGAGQAPATVATFTTRNIRM